MSQETLEKMKKIHAQYRDFIFGFSGVNSFGIGDGVFRVGLEYEDEEIKSMPHALEGFPIELTLGGPIVAL